MASKIKGQTMYLPITPYKVAGCEDEFNELSVTVDFDDRRKHFYVAVHAGWKSSWGGHGCIIMGDSDPLTASQFFVVKESPKNSQKYLDQMYANLEAGKEAIAWLFDHRKWQKLNVAVRNIALYGYTEQFRKQMEELINSTNNNINNQNSEDKVMTTKNNNQESVNAANEQQVENVNVGEATIDNIMPKMSAEPKEPVKVEGSEYTVKDDEGKDVTFESVVPGAIAKAANDGTATTMPLGQHGTLVIASGGGEKSKPRGIMPKVTLKKKTPQPAPIAEPSTLSRVSLVTFTTKRGETAPRIVGFSGEDDPRWKQHYAERMALAKSVKEAKAKDPKAKGQSDPFGASWMTDHQTGTVTYCMTFGVRYMDVAKRLVEAYNTTDSNLWKQAEQAVIDTKNGIVAGYQAEKAARRAEREAKKQQATTQPATTQGKTYTAAEMEATIREAFGALAGVLKADAKQFEPLIAAAMKKAA